MNMPSFNNATRSLFYGACKNERARVNFTDKILKFADFKARNYSENNIAIVVGFKFTG